MEAANRRAIVSEIDRYESLGIRELLSKSSEYVIACKELSFILRSGYSKFAKNLQSVILQDAFLAFSVLPQMQTQSAISAANALLQSAESVLPKQKRAQAVKEHKHAVVMRKRKPKANHEEEGLNQLPHDVLVHTFSFLDVKSLLAAAAVCQSWNAAACDNHLWKILYTTFFGNSNNCAEKNEIKTHGVTRNEDNMNSLDNIGTSVGIDWRCAYKTAHKEAFRKFNSNWVYCFSCWSIVRLSSIKCFSRHSLQIKAITTQQIIGYILDGFIWLDSSDSDSDDEDDDRPVLKLWSYSRAILSCNRSGRAFPYIDPHR